MRAVPSRFKLLLGFALFLIVSSACSSGGSSTTSPPVVGTQHVVLVVLENTNFSDVANSSSAPYLNSLTSKGSLIKNYFANVHPSIGNYFELTTGAMASTQDTFTGTVSPPTIVESLSSAGKTWRFYGESMPSVGYLGGDQFPYLRRHNPFSYFTSVQGSTAEAANIVPFSQFSADLANGNLPAFAMVVPNAVDDAHSCPDQTTTSCTLAQRLSTADTWMRKNIDPLLSNPNFQHGVLAVTFDESWDDNMNGGGQVFTVVVGTGVKQNFVATGTYQHQSLLRTILQMLGASSFPGDASNAPAMTEILQ